MMNRTRIQTYLIQPHFVKGLDWVKAEYKSVNGIIRSEWERKGEQVILKVTIPVNTNANSRI